MILLHKINGDEITLNADLIISVEALPDTRISMTDRRTMLVAEPVAEVVAAVLEYRRDIATGARLTGAVAG